MELTVQNHHTIEEIASLYNYLDNILLEFELYKCPCITCIDAFKNKIINMREKINTFYYFLIDNKYFIKENETYLKKIKELLKNMIIFNNIILHDDIVLINTQISVSIIYIEEDYEDDINEIITQNATFQIENIVKYYPEMKYEFVCVN